jgi:RNA polymerase sigma-70 factor (ECF subfamily)
MGEDSDAPERESFDAFYRREQRAVVALSYVLCGDASVAEELAQDAFLEAMRSWDRVVRMDSPGAWVRRVVANRSVSRFRRLLVESRAHRLSRAGAAVVSDPDSAGVWVEVRRLPKRQAQVVALTYLHDLSRRDTAAVLRCSEETVKTHLDRARRTLAARLTETGWGDR